MLLTKSISFHVSATINVTVGDFSKNVWANVDTLKANLDGLLSTAIIRGDNPSELIKYLKPLVKETVLNKRYAAERIARTESARVQYKAQLDSLKTNDYKYCKWYIEPGACKACREIAISNSGGNLPEGIYEVETAQTFQYILIAGVPLEHGGKMKQAIVILIKAYLRKQNQQ